ncbi:endonuclease/exonuclease/phosphatase (EEP) superfamily protein YafD [Ulvibacter sp. MAR_2010_11]|uniref:endonuclease/exonuclease/phosphatase family protein n=1 Tax=Ulvibacter sp. MAR_2010_11 TaxID=1250229 RepID=UPI000C2C9C4B|nr:endonuclease/exonuclease/phosphatase family protein [Ulvibacter sp. MAR_2010_11]PKA82568.1 endonuclease/exonuclease/phosphatase (EEP) superfamily protein YafD [Ulvibacter sp. MAR_2010_11]
MIALYILSFIFIISPFFPATGNPHWFFRTPDFIRLQSIFVEIVLLVLLILFEDKFTILSWSITTALVVVIIYQMVKVFPYSHFYPRKKPNYPSKGCISILAANVLQTNTNYKQFESLIEQYNADIVITMESNKDWELGLEQIESKYPYSVKIPKENFYGMHLYSKSKPKNVTINYLVDEETPSIFLEYPVSETRNIFIAILHPAPPSPTENETSIDRDAELMLIGKEIEKKDMPVVVCGDMNDVVWSRTTRLFKKMTSMVDPRVGRGFFSTYHAGYFFMRFPLDHLFHTKDLFVKKMVRTPNFGSDHFGMYYEIHLKKNDSTPSTSQLNGDEKEEVSEIIDKASD